MLDEDARRRLYTNPLRILDTKNPEMQELVNAAPRLLDFLGEESRAFLARMEQLVSAAGIEYVINPRLVRGLDYYNHTVFEWITDKLGAQGTICGGGQELARKIIEDERARIKSFLDDNRELVESCENSDTIPGRVRPRLINLSNCENVWISGITLKNGPSWNVHMIYCDDIQTDHCTFVSEGVWNGDGWDPDSSTNCTLFASEFFTGDDAVAIKSGKNPEGNEINRPCAHIRVFDCRSDCGHGICIGSEMSGGVEDVQIWDCDLANSLSGIEIKATSKRGGYVRGVTVRDCITPRVMLHSVPYNDDGVPAGAPPKLEHCFFERLTLTAEVLDHDRSRHDAAPIEIAGFDKPGYEVEDIAFKDITITKPSVALPLGLCKGVTLSNLACVKE